MSRSSALSNIVGPVISTVQQRTDHTAESAHLLTEEFQSIPGVRADDTAKGLSVTGGLFFGPPTWVVIQSEGAAAGGLQEVQKVLELESVHFSLSLRTAIPLPDALLSLLFPADTTQDPSVLTMVFQRAIATVRRATYQHWRALAPLVILVAMYVTLNLLPSPLSQAIREFMLLLFQ